MTESWTADWPFYLVGRLWLPDGYWFAQHVDPLHPRFLGTNLTVPFATEGYYYSIDSQGKFVRQYFGHTE